MARRGGDDGDRPKLSTREIDKLRDKGGPRKKREERDQERLERSPMYERYKSQVSSMLSGGELPDTLREKLDPSGEMKARDELLKKVKKLISEDRKGWSEAVFEFVQKFDLPDDAYLLTEWLDHPKDRVVEKSLGKLQALADAGALVGSKLPKSLDQRLRGVEMGSTDPDVQAQAKTLREKLRG